MLYTCSVGLAYIVRLECELFVLLGCIATTELALCNVFQERSEWIGRRRLGPIYGAKLSSTSGQIADLALAQSATCEMKVVASLHRGVLVMASHNLSSKSQLHLSLFDLSAARLLLGRGRGRLLAVSRLRRRRNLAMGTISILEVLCKMPVLMTL